MPKKISTVPAVAGLGNGRRMIATLYVRRAGSNASLRWATRCLSRANEYCGGDKKLFRFLHEMDFPLQSGSRDDLTIRFIYFLKQRGNVYNRIRSRQEARLGESLGINGYLIQSCLQT